MRQIFTPLGAVNMSSAILPVFNTPPGSKQRTSLLIGARPMLPSPWHYQAFARPQADNAVSEFDANCPFQTMKNSSSFS